MSLYDMSVFGLPKSFSFIMSNDEDHEKNF